MGSLQRCPITTPPALNYKAYLFQFYPTSCFFQAQGRNSVHILTVVGFSARQTTSDSYTRLERRPFYHVANHNNAKARGICKLTVNFRF